MQKQTAADETPIAAPIPRLKKEIFGTSENVAPGAGMPKTMDDYCKTCRRNTTWDEVRSWSNSYGLSDLHPADIRIGWKCRTCSNRKGL